ncbi:MAG TPA: hypothetical protein VJM57_06490 [Thermodesulfobacteriota bacterium]|nr:hypothetical protein [Thermodesulfobacteriota bacterium]
MRNLKLGILVLLAAFMVAGCATTEAIPNLKKDKTSAEDVLEMFGEPDRKSQSSQGDVWTYTFSREGTRPGERTLLDLKITFDERVLKEYEILVSEAKDEGLERRPTEGTPQRPIPPGRPMPQRPFPPRY